MALVWLITGASRGLGRALAEAVVAAGHSLVATARDASHVADLERSAPDRVRAVALDVTDAAAAERAVAAAIDAFGRLDVLVNNAGYSDIGPVEDTAIADFRAQVETNLFGVLNVTKAAIPVMRTQRSGRVIQMSSVGGRLAPPGRGAYAAAKAGVAAFSEVLAKEVGPLGIKVTVVEPGGFRTDFAGSSTTVRPGRPEYDATVGAMIRFQREFNGKQPGDPARAAAAILHLATMAEPPVRLLLGRDAFDAAEQRTLAQLESDRRHRDLSLSTDYGTTGGPVELPWKDR